MLTVVLFHPPFRYLRHQATGCAVEKPPLDDRAPMALAAAWAANITTISMEMVVPIVLGYWVDTWLGTRVVFVILGAIGGMTLGMFHLVRLVSGPKTKQERSRQDVLPEDRSS